MDLAGKAKEENKKPKPRQIMVGRQQDRQTVRQICLFCWLLNVPASCECISETDVRQKTKENTWGGGGGGRGGGGQMDSTDKGTEKTEQKAENRQDN